MDKGKSKDILLAGIMIFLAILVSVATIIYLFTEKMIPGLIPLGTAVLMVPNILIWRDRQENGKVYAILFMVAGILNLIAGVMQIIMSVS